MTARTRNITIIAVAVVLVCVLFVCGVLVGAAVVGYRAAIRAGNEAATVQNLKTIAAVEVQYFNTHKRVFGTFEELIGEQMLSAKFSGNPVVADGYVLELKLGGGLQSSYSLTADPQDISSGRNHFYLDSTSEKIHVNPDRRAGASDPLQ